MNLFADGAGIILDLEFSINLNAVELSGILNATLPELADTRSTFGNVSFTFSINEIGPGHYSFTNFFSSFKSTLGMSSYF